MPSLGRGKHSIRLYAGRSLPGRCPWTPLPPAPKGEKGCAMKKRKTEICTLRLTKADKEKIRQQAKRAGMTMTDFLTAAALGKDIVVLDGIHELTAQVKAAGRNLNQLTTLANMGRITSVRLDEVTEAFADICSALRRLTREVK